jgi:hypothetical protein
LVVIRVSNREGCITKRVFKRVDTRYLREGNLIFLLLNIRGTELVWVGSITERRSNKLTAVWSIATTTFATSVASSEATSFSGSFTPGNGPHHLADLGPVVRTIWIFILLFPALAGIRNILIFANVFSHE